MSINEYISSQIVSMRFNYVQFIDKYNKVSKMRIYFRNRKFFLMNPKFILYT